jgi:hypothetical protein
MSRIDDLEQRLNAKAEEELSERIRAAIAPIISLAAELELLRHGDPNLRADPPGIGGDTVRNRARAIGTSMELFYRESYGKAYVRQFVDRVSELHEAFDNILSETEPDGDIDKGED